MKKKPVRQKHHISYDPEWWVWVYQGEHWAITQLNRRKNVSCGLLDTLEDYINRHKRSAHDLDTIPEIDNDTV